MAVPGLAVGAAVLLLHVAVVVPYPGGKVTESCHDMVPGHGHTPHPDPVHNVTVSRATFAPGDRLEVTLSGPEFKGFLLEARNAEDLDGPPVGSFTLMDSDVSQLLTCGDRQGSAVSHTNPHKKTEIHVHWTAPQRAPNHVQFLATVVEKYKTYWVKIPSAVISQANAPPFSTPEATAAPSSTSPPVSRLTKPFSASGCGNKKFCVRSPSACDPEKEHDCVFLSFTRDGQSVVAELSGPSKGYLSFAFSHDRWMGDDDAYLCVQEGHAVRVQPSHLTGRSHPVLDASDALEEVAWRLEDGVMQCSFRRNVTLPGAENRFALNTSYYIFLASGAVEEGRLYRHSQQPLITYDRYDVTGPPEDLGGSQSPLLLKAHGALMLVAWVAAVSIGVIVARFFKPVLSHPLFGEAAWFQVHRTLMLTTCVLTGIAFVLPFVYRGGWSRENMFPDHQRRVFRSYTILPCFFFVEIIVGETAVFCLQLATRDFENQEKTIFTGDCCYINPLVRRTVRFLGSYAFGLFATDIFVNAGQVVTGNLAPHFLALCKPNYTALGCQQLTQFISGAEACTGNPDLITRARKTFPSKEAAISVYAAMYLTMYITNTIKAKGTRLAKPVLCLGLMCLAFLTGLNRVAEYRNHWSDVIAGFLVGISIAVFLVVCVVNNFKGRQPEQGHLHMTSLAHTPMVSIPRVESPLEKNHIAAFAEVT